MNGASLSYNFSDSPPAAAPPASPCGEAYGLACDASDRLHSALVLLRSRLEIVMRPVLPATSATSAIGSADAGPQPKAPESEMHGLLLAMRERTQDDVEVVLDMLQRLTV